jgi:intein/homing endonuclease
MERRLKREVFYARVAAVEEVMLDGWLYDVSVADHDNFVAGGMLVHSTS